VNGRPRLDQALELIAESVELLHRLRVQLVALDGKRRSISSTGYRSASLTDGGPTGRRLTGDGHGDPIGELVAAEVDAEADDVGPVRSAYGQGLRASLATVSILRSAVETSDAVLNPKPPAKPEDEGCTSHAAHGFKGVPTRTPGSDLCRWCADFWRRHNQRPSLNDLQVLEERRVAAEMRERYAA
jgi:hypothetical protein